MPIQRKAFLRKLLQKNACPLEGPDGDTADDDGSGTDADTESSDDDSADREEPMEVAARGLEGGGI